MNSCKLYQQIPVIYTSKFWELFEATAFILYKCAYSLFDTVTYINLQYASYSICCGCFVCRFYLKTESLKIFNKGNISLHPQMKCGCHWSNFYETQNFQTALCGKIHQILVKSVKQLGSHSLHCLSGSRSIVTTRAKCG